MERRGGRYAGECDWDRNSCGRVGWNDGLLAAGKARYRGSAGGAGEGQSAALAGVAGLEYAAHWSCALLRFRHLALLSAGTLRG